MQQTLNIPEIHENDVGTMLRFSVKKSVLFPLDLSQTNNVKLHFRRPDRTTFSVDCQLEQDDSTLEPGELGNCFYVTQDGDMTPSGQWFLQLEITFPDGHWNTSIVNFPVFPNIN